MTVPEERLAFDSGKGQVSAAFARPPEPVATLVVSHGAGSGMDHPFLVGFTRAMNEQAIATLRFNFPYMEAGRRSTDPQPVAVAAWRAAFEAAVARAGGGQVFAGGKSYGGRMASVAVAEGMPAAGLVFLGYPLHPPGKPERVRDEHLYAIEVPMLFLHGTLDPFADPRLLKRVIDRLGTRATLLEVTGGDHSFNVRGAKKEPREVGASLAPLVASFIRELV
ncbi:MAG: dienelactone hydrolase [Actinobacteria bacterium]|nr:dienelactone hydrolase [Actinomycetota bacterium]